MFRFCKIIIFVFSSVVGEVQISVTPEAIEPDFTPYFSLTCSLAEVEGRITSITIFRGSYFTAKGEDEQVATINQFSPNVAKVNVPGQQVTAVGQLFPFGMEEASYLTVVWPQPSVEELGVYTCNASARGEFGMPVTFTANVLVSTEDLLMDRLLVRLRKLEILVGGLNKTLHSSLPEETTTASSTTSTSSPLTTTSESTTTDKLQQEKESDTFEQTLEKLADAVGTIGNKLDSLNTSLAKLDMKMDKLERKQIEDENGNDTLDDEEEIDSSSAQLELSFQGNGTDYSLYKSTERFSPQDAEEFCSTLGFYLAELKNDEEKAVINENLVPQLKQDELMTIAGVKTNNDQWVWPRNLKQVTIMNWSANEPITNGDCLSLRRSADDFQMTFVPCELSRVNAYFLCQSDNTI